MNFNSIPLSNITYSLCHEIYFIIHNNISIRIINVYPFIESPRFYLKLDKHFMKSIFAFSISDNIAMGIRKNILQHQMHLGWSNKFSKHNCFVMYPLFIFQ